MVAIKTRITDRGIIQTPAGEGEAAQFVIDLPTTLQGSTLTTSGGGGSTVIEDGGTITGTYQGDILCLGDVTVDGNVEVLGSMVVRGDFINSGGHEVTIRGDLFAQDIDFSKSDTSTPQSNFTVDGDLIFIVMNFQQCGGSAAILRVGGDLIGSAGYITSPLNGQGITSGTPGLGIIVYGDISVGEINIYGAEGTTGPAGQGGYIDVWGSLNVYYQLYAYGGNGTDYDAGQGGYIDAYGDFIAGQVWVNGGDATGSGANGGQGGHIEVGGNFVANSGVITYGGNALDGNGGNGGYIEVYGNFVANGGAQLRGGSTTDGSGGNGGNGGYIDVGGGITASDNINIHGGDAINGDGGSGGWVYSIGSIDMGYDSIDVQGGSATNGNAGNGGNIEVGGNITVQSLYLNGGDCDSDNEMHRAGSGGSIDDIEGNAVINSLCTVNGGDRSGSLSASNLGQTPDAGNITVEGDLICEELYGRGGSVYTTGGTPHRAGNGSNYIDVLGNLVCDDEIDISGGDSNTNDPDGDRDGGTGGALSVEGTSFIDDFYSRGGNATIAGGSGGGLYLRGHATVGWTELSGGEGRYAGDGGEIEAADVTVKGGDEIVLDGGDCNTTFSIASAGEGGDVTCASLNQGPYGNSRVSLRGGLRTGTTTEIFDDVATSGGGTFTCRGNCNIYEILCDGGSVTTPLTNRAGGQGGDVIIGGNVVCNTISVEGGFALTDDDSANPGGPGGTVTIGGHATVDTIAASGGQTASTTEAPAAAGNVTLTGGGAFGTIYMLKGSGGAAVPIGGTSTLSLRSNVSIGTLDMTDESEFLIKSSLTAPTTLRIGAMPEKTTLNEDDGTPTSDISSDLASSIFISETTGGTWYKLTGTGI